MEKQEIHGRDSMINSIGSLDLESQIEIQLDHGLIQLQISGEDLALQPHEQLLWMMLVDIIALTFYLKHLNFNHFAYNYISINYLNTVIWGFGVCAIGWHYYKNLK